MLLILEKHILVVCSLSSIFCFSSLSMREVCCAPDLFARRRISLLFRCCLCHFDAGFVISTPILTFRRRIYHFGFGFLIVASNLSFRHKMCLLRLCRFDVMFSFWRRICWIHNVCVLWKRWSLVLCVVRVFLSFWFWYPGAVFVISSLDLLLRQQIFRIGVKFVTSTPDLSLRRRICYVVVVFDVDCVLHVARRVCYFGIEFVNSASGLLFFWSCVLRVAGVMRKDSQGCVSCPYFLLFWLSHFGVGFVMWEWHGWGWFLML